MHQVIYNYFRKIYDTKYHINFNPNGCIYPTFENKKNVYEEEIYGEHAVLYTIYMNILG